MKDSNGQNYVEAVRRRTWIGRFRRMKTTAMPIPFSGEIDIDRVHVISGILNPQFLLDAVQDAAGSASYVQNPCLLMRPAILADNSFLS